MTKLEVYKPSRYKQILEEGNPFAIISKIIDDHTWEYYFDEGSLEMVRKPTEVTFVQCKGCPMCKQIEEQVSRISDFKIAKVLSRDADTLQAKDVARLLNLGVGKKQLQQSIGKTKFTQLIKRLNNDQEALKTFLWYGVPISKVSWFLKFLPEEYYEAKESLRQDALENVDKIKFTGVV